MDVLRNIAARATQKRKHIVLAEGIDPRIAEAAVRAAKDGMADITLLGPLDVVWNQIQKAGDHDNLVRIIDPQSSIRLERYQEIYYELRKHKNIEQHAASLLSGEALNFANLMVRSGDADGSVAGAAHTTPDVVRSALQIIGLDQHHDLVSSLFIMVMDERIPHLKHGVIYADCGLVIEPDAGQLASIAAAASDNARALLALDPKVAMLSFSTRGSASHPAVDKVEKAAAILRKNRPDLPVEGGIQFDAALIDSIGRNKAPGSHVAGRANVFIFPDLNSGNIAYKITERLGGATAIGPILQGLAKPANDLSRGCSAEDVYNMIAVTALQAQTVAETAK